MAKQKAAARQWQSRNVCKPHRQTTTQTERDGRQGESKQKGSVAVLEGAAASTRPHNYTKGIKGEHNGRFLKTQRN